MRPAKNIGQAPAFAACCGWGHPRSVGCGQADRQRPNTELARESGEWQGVVKPL